MTKSMEDLKTAFAGESQANRKYLAFAKKADDEGHPQIARLFRAAAEAEAIHANNHLVAMDGIKSTKENLQTAIEGEHYEVSSMYPTFLADAQAEDNTGASQTFGYALKVEKIHEALYRKAVDTIEETEQYDYYVCPICGNTFARNAPDTCPICATSKERFIRVK